MPETALVRMLGNSRKNVAVNIVIIGNAFIWYSYAFSYLTTAIASAGLANDFLSIVAIHFLGIFASVIIGEFVSRRTEHRLQFIKYWILAGSLLSLIPLVTGVSTYLGLAVFSAIGGSAFGFGIPVCLGYFAESTEPANRGRLGGITFLLIGVGAFLISRIGAESILVTSLVLAGWRATGLVILFALKPNEKQTVQKRKLSYRYVFTNRAFLLYFVPWTMFLLVNSFAFPVIERQFSPELVRFSSSIEFVLGGLSAVIFGFLADSVGRKRLAVAGFALLGLGYAVLSFSSGNMFGWWFYTFVDGVAWGSFAMIFLFALWGDLAEDKGAEKLYSVGIMPYLISTFMRFSMGTFVANAIENYAMIFSYASFFLFVAVLPLVFAPETLSEKTMKDRELKKYIEKAQKEVVKTQSRENEGNQEENQCENKDQEELVEFQVNQEDDEKARELAEKYY